MAAGIPRFPIVTGERPEWMARSSPIPPGRSATPDRFSRLSNARARLTGTPRLVWLGWAGKPSLGPEHLHPLGLRHRRLSVWDVDGSAAGTDKTAGARPGGFPPPSVRRRHDRALRGPTRQRVAGRSSRQARRRARFFFILLLLLFSTLSFQAVRRAPDSTSSFAFNRRMCVIPDRPQPPGIGRKTSGSSRTKSACNSGVSFRFP
jgi:hypothetical protein